VSQYYSHKLSAERLKQVYDLAPWRVRQYLDAEVNHVLEKIRPGDLVIELRCGYGRILPKLAEKAGWVIGIDTSVPTLEFAHQALDMIPNCSLYRMDAVKLAFHDRAFDCVVCIQNGISAFHVDQRRLVSESVRVARAGGIVLFSSYSHKFWNHRLEWFQLQSAAGLLGEIDCDKTMDGDIVCKDGFTATTVDAEDFRALTANLVADVRIVEIDESSLFCEIEPLGDARCSQGQGT
jgi:2-polyprenyl-6-hydroxyphenyl methylase/3-demethylubiquinone-9 3-methyltransferase